MPIKSTTTTEGGKEKKKKIQRNLQDKSKHKKNKCFSWVTAVRVLSLSGSHSPPHLPRMPSNTGYWTYCGGSSDSDFGPTAVCSCLQCPQLSELVHFLLWELSVTFYIFHRHRVCLVDRVDLICSLYSWWESFGSSSLAILPLGSNCGFISTFASGSYTGVCSWGFTGGLGFTPVKARCGGGAAAWVTGVLAAPCTQGSWWLGKQEMWCSGRVWQPVLANMLLYSCLENPCDREAWQATVYRVAKSWTLPKWPCVYRCKAFFACGSSAPVRVEREGGTDAWLVGALALQSV